MENAKEYKKGFPLSIAVDRIFEKYPIDKLVNGMKITYNNIEELIDADKRSSRFKSVTAKWRKIVLNTSNFIIEPIRGKSFKVLEDKGKLNLMLKKREQANTLIKKSVQVSTKINRDNLSYEDRKTLDFHTMNLGKMSSLMQIRKNSPELPTLI